MDVTAEGDLPTLRRWLDGVEDHPLRWFFKSRRREPLPPGAVYAWWRNPILTPIEETLVLLEAAAPAGLGAKRREFRAARGMGQPAMEKFMPLRAELIVASLLAEATVPFRFNTGAGPDLLVGGDSPAFGIEIGSRSPSSLSHLSRALSAALRERGLPDGVEISTDPIPPVAIRTSVQRSIIEQFVPPDGSPGVSALRVMAAPARPAYGIPASWLTIRRGGGTTSSMAPYNSPHMLALAQSVAVEVLRDKRKIRQSQELPSILIVDLSGGDLPDLRYWETTFGPLWQPTDTYLALGAMRALNTRRVPEIRFSVNPYADKAAVGVVAEPLRGVAPLADLANQADRRPR